MAVSTWFVADTSSTTAYSGSSPVTTPTGHSFTINWTVNPGTATSTHPSYQPGKAYTFAQLEEAWYDGAACSVEDSSRIKPGRDYRMPDGARLLVDGSGNYRIEDKGAKVVYKANRVREFSPHLNASDMLAKFVEYVATLGVKQKDVMGLPIELFVNWLVITAAERDADPVPPDVKPVVAHPAIKDLMKPKCLACGRFIPRDRHTSRFDFCNAAHGEKYAKRQLESRSLAG